MYDDCLSEVAVGDGSFCTMSDWSLDLYGRRASIKPVIRVALVLSLLLHAATLWRFPLEIRFPSSEPDGRDRGGPLVVQLAPPPPPRSVPSAPATPSREARQTPVAPPQPARKPVARPVPDKPVIALAKPAPETPVPKQPPVPAAQPPVRPPPGDFMADVEARRRARSEQAPAASAESAPRAAAPDDENARANRIAAANLGVGRKPTFGPESNSGGVFTIQRLGYDSAEFRFFGWSKEIRHNTSQLIEVRRGNAPDIRIAVVRRMIAIIREYEKEEFVWESPRLGRYLTLSARLKDNAGLEEFMMREFFADYRGP